MSHASYRNHEHYIREEWPTAPKQTFVALAEQIAAAGLAENALLLDVGCATGELIHYLGRTFPGFSFTGVDVFDELIDEAQRRVPEARFLKASGLELPFSCAGVFDAVTALGVLSIFDETELVRFWDQLLGATRDGGWIWVLAPLNEYGVDCMIRHRKRVGGRVGDWETGWNIHSQESIAEVLEERCREFRFHPFRIGLDLPRREDPVRTWTIRTENSERQLTNGMKLLVDHYIIEVQK